MTWAQIADALGMRRKAPPVGFDKGEAMRRFEKLKAKQAKARTNGS